MSQVSLAFPFYSVKSLQLALFIQKTTYRFKRESNLVLVSNTRDNKLEGFLYYIPINLIIFKIFHFPLLAILNKICNVEG